MNAAETPSDLVDPITVLRRWGPVLVIAALVGGMLGALFGSRVQSVYEATAVVLVGPVVPDSDLLEGTTDLARTYGEIFESTEVIRRAVEGTGVTARQVDVAASAGRDSATVSVRVRTPSRDATEQIVVRLVELLREIVADNRAELNTQIWGDVDPSADPTASEPGDPSAAFPIGSAITVIDDGTGRISDRSLGLAQGGLLGAMVGALVVAAIGLGVETRKADDPLSRVLADRFGSDLGRLTQLPSIRAFFMRRRWRRAVPVSKRRPQDLRYIAEGTLVGPDADLSQTVFIAAPSSHPSYVRAAMQLCSGFEEAPVLIDPIGVVADQFAPPTFSRLRSERFSVMVNKRVVADLVQPGPDRRPVDSDSAHDQVTELRGDAPVVFVFVPVDSSISSWLWWASTADRSVALVRPQDLRPENAVPFVDRVELSAVPLDGAIALSRKWLVGRVGRVQVSEVRESDRVDHLAEQLGQMTGAR